MQEISGKTYLNIGTVKCSKCGQPMRAAWCVEKYDNGNLGVYYGPEAFDAKTIEIAKNENLKFGRISNGITEYNGIVCPECGKLLEPEFVGKCFNTSEKEIEVSQFKRTADTNLTLHYYNKKAHIYIQNTVNVDFSERQNEFINMIPDGGKILDLGCGSGRDSMAFINKGYKVTSLDGSDEMCIAAARLTGQEVINCRFQKYDTDTKFDGIWACASLLHLSRKDILQVVRKLNRNLKKEGCFYMSFKYGNFSGERNGRLFTDMTEAEIREIISKVPDLEISEMKITEDVRPGRKNEKWLNIFALKNSQI